jgi:hypothetical protein
MGSLNVPARFGGVEKKRAHVESCKVCGDFGTVLIGSAQRESRTMKQAMSNEAPCVCSSGDLWRKLFEDFGKATR